MSNSISSPMVFKNFKTFHYTLAGRPLVVETGKLAGLANGSCLVRYGDTAVLCCATASEKPRDGIDFLPLSVDFDERMYAAGKIPGGYLRREGRPPEKAILTSRVIDRPIRPLFPKDLRNDVSLSLTVMSYDPDCSPEITAMIGASIALSISDIPWNGPISGVFMGLVNGELVVNPTEAQRAVSDLELTVASSMTKVVMIEAGANEVPDDLMFDAIMLAHKENQGVLEFINAIVDEIGKTKFEYPSCELDHDMFDKIFAFCEKDVMVALDTDDKTVRDARMFPIKEAILANFTEEYPEIEGMMDYGAEVSAVRVNNDSKYLKDLEITYNGRDWVEPNIPSYDEDAEIMKFVSQSQTFCATVKDSEGVYLISSTDGGKTWEQRRAWSTAVIKTNLYWDEATGMFKGSYETQSLLQCIKSRDGVNWTTDGMPYAKL